MEEILKTNNTRFKKSVPDKLYQELFGPHISNIDEKLSQIIINTEDKGLAMYITSIHKVYRIYCNVTTSVTKNSIFCATASKGLPNGKLTIKFESGDEWNLNNIIFGRVYDFAQDIKPKKINSANYDNTIRGQFPQLLDPDHAEEVDRLRRYMQDGHISHYEFDDANPCYPKAGK